MSAATADRTGTGVDREAPGGTGDGEVAAVRAPGVVRQSTFAATRVRNFRIYLAGQSIASTGTWMQNIAQDWLVLQLTHSPAAVGVTTALQFLPMLLLGMYGGMVADRYPKRTVLMVTQSVNGLLTALLAVLTITGHIRVGQVWLFALAGGLVFVVDNPTRQVFVNELVPPALLRNAISLNSAVFQTTRLIGPAVAALLINAFGCGWAFAANAVCYLGPLTGLAFIRSAELRRTPALVRAPGQLRSALHYVGERPQIAWTIALVGIVGTFGLNFPVVLTGMASTTFHGGASLYGLFNVMLAIGSVTGALLAGRRTRTGLGVLVVGAAAFGVAQATAALAPDRTVFLGLLVVMGLTNLAFQATANSSVQLSVDPAFRGRVMGLYILVFTGGTPFGGPLIGWITSQEGPRVGMLVCGLVPALACGAIALILARARSHAPAAAAGRRLAHA